MPRYPAGRSIPFDDAAQAKLRAETIEECCAAICQDCADGLPVGRDPLGVWWHQRMSSLCLAHKIREVMQTGRAMDAFNTDAKRSA